MRACRLYLTTIMAGDVYGWFALLWWESVIAVSAPHSRLKNRAHGKAHVRRVGGRDAVVGLGPHDICNPWVVCPSMVARCSCKIRSNRRSLMYKTEHGYRLIRGDSVCFKDNTLSACQELRVGPMRCPRVMWGIPCCASCVDTGTVKVGERRIKIRERLRRTVMLKGWERVLPKTYRMVSSHEVLRNRIFLLDKCSHIVDDFFP